MFFASVNITLAQSPITGTVKGEDGKPLYGVTVKVKGTLKAVITDLDGKYSIQASGTDVLEFTFVGLAKQEVNVDGREVVDISMGEDATQLGNVELIETGYGKVSKAGFTGAASVVGGEEMDKAPVSSFQRALQGNSAGVQVSGSSGQPGGGSDIRIRGIGSVNASSSPLYVIDGIPIISQNLSRLGPSADNRQTANILASMNPDDIASVTILKDASAVSIYGARAANGVVLITTKQGKKGEAKFNVTIDGGVSALPLGRKYDLASSDQIYKLYYDAYYASNGGDSDAAAKSAGTILNSNPYNLDNPYDANGNLKPDAKLLVNTNWFDKVFRMGSYRKYGVDFSGATDKTRYFTSFGYFSQEGK